MSLTNTLVRDAIINTNRRKEYIVPFTEINDGGAFTTVDIVLEVFPAGFIHEASRIWHEVAVAGAAGPITAATARLKLVTAATSPVSTNLGAGALDVYAAPGVLDGTSSITSVTKVAGDLEATTSLIMTVTETGATTGLSDVTAGEIHAVLDYQILA